VCYISSSAHAGLGMLIRDGASQSRHGEVARAQHNLGSRLVFAMGVALAAFAGMDRRAGISRCIPAWETQV